MKLQPDRIEGLNVINAYDATSVTVNGVVHTTSIVLPTRDAVSAWNAATTDDLTESHFRDLLPLQPELVVFGSGASLRFVKPDLHRALIDNGIGLETMDTRAACRTYNILAGEGRRVVAVLLIGAQ